MFQRVEQLLGTDALSRIGAQRLIIFGMTLVSLVI